MTFLFDALQIDRLTHQRIRDRRGEGPHDGPGAPLCVQHLLPERHRAHAAERGLVEFWPRQGLRVEPLVAFDELAAEPFLVRLGADLHHATAAAGRGVRIKRRAKRTRRGTVIGRRRRGS